MAASTTQAHNSCMYLNPSTILCVSVLMRVTESETCIVPMSSIKDLSNIRITRVPRSLVKKRFTRCQYCEADSCGRDLARF